MCDKERGHPGGADDELAVDPAAVNMSSLSSSGGRMPLRTVGAL